MIDAPLKKGYDMEKRVFVCNSADIPLGSMRTFSVNGHLVAMANVGGDFFAVDDICTHEQCSLDTDDALDGNILICGCHGTMFDIQSGKVMAPSAIRDVKSYEVKVSDNDIFIRL